MGKRILTVSESMGLLITQEGGGLDEIKHFTSAIVEAEFNVAVGLTRLGHTVGYLTWVGRDPFGRQICRYMEQIELDTGLTRMDQGRRTGFMLQSKTSQGGPDIRYFRIGSTTSALSPVDVTGLDLQEWDAVHLTGILPAISPAALAASYALADKARKAGVPVFFGPSLRPQLWPCRDSMVVEVNALAALVGYIMPGVEEGEILCSSKGPEKIGRFYMEQGARAVIVKTGVDGAKTFTRAGSFRTLAYRVEKVVDTVGAGNGFAIGVESALMEELSLGQAVGRGSTINATQITYASGNEDLPTRDGLEQFMAQASRFDKTGETSRQRKQIVNQIIEQISHIDIVPVITIDEAEKAVLPARALVTGGLPAAEVTFRTTAGEEAIRHIATEVPEMLVSVDTVLTTGQADHVTVTGAQFIISPDFNPAITHYVIDRGILMMPDTASPDEMERAMSMGLDVMKFFPAEQNGGVAKLKALADPYTNLRWMPTGGVNTKNPTDYLSFDKTVACGGTWTVRKGLIEGEQQDKITRICREAIQIMPGFKSRHMSINCDNEAEAEKTTRIFCALFQLPYKPGSSSVFIGSAVECMRNPYPGKHGHVAIGTNSVKRAIYHLGLRGVTLDRTTHKTDGVGKTKTIYLDGEADDFALQLAQK